VELGRFTQEKVAELKKDEMERHLELSGNPMGVITLRRLDSN
jgi:hypothetical protein